MICIAILLCASLLPAEQQPAPEPAPQSLPKAPPSAPAAEAPHANAPADPTADPTDAVLARMLLFTWPYDEAWFLMLLSELSQHLPLDSADRPRLKKLREVHEGRLFTALDKVGFPEFAAEENDEGEKRPAQFIGSYQSWLWTYMLLQWSEPVSEGASERLAALRESKLLPGRTAFDAKEFRAGPYDFLWVPALFALEDPARRADYSAGEVGPWPKEVSLRNVHILGQELCRVWPLNVTPVYAERVGALLEREDLSAGDFTVVSHWIPQFLYIGRWLRDQ